MRTSIECFRKYKWNFIVCIKFLNPETFYKYFPYLINETKKHINNSLALIFSSNSFSSVNHLYIQKYVQKINLINIH